VVSERGMGDATRATGPTATAPKPSGEMGRSAECACAIDDISDELWKTLDMSCQLPKLNFGTKNSHVRKMTIPPYS
jgi:hypothetical protein